MADEGTDWMNEPGSYYEGVEERKKRQTGEKGR